VGKVRNRGEKCNTTPGSSWTLLCSYVYKFILLNRNPTYRSPVLLPTRQELFSSARDGRARLSDIYNIFFICRRVNADGQPFICHLLSIKSRSDLSHPRSTFFRMIPVFHSLLSPVLFLLSFPPFLPGVLRPCPSCPSGLFHLQSRL